VLREFCSRKWDQFHNQAALECCAAEHKIGHNAFIFLGSLNMDRLDKLMLRLGRWAEELAGVLDRGKRA